MLACRLEDSRGNGSAHAPQSPGQAEGAEQEAAGGGSPGGAAEKLLRGLQKKLRQCEALQERQARGDALTGPELEKLSKIPSWYAPLFICHLLSLLTHMPNRCSQQSAERRVCAVQASRDEGVGSHHRQQWQLRLLLLLIE